MPPLPTGLLIEDSIAACTHVITEAVLLCSVTLVLITVSAPNLVIPVFLEHPALSNLLEQIPLSV
jgi:hypothetical protein